MKIIIFLILFFNQSCILKANEIRHIEIDHTTLYYHYLKSAAPSEGLLIFLHGSVKAFQGKPESKPVDTDILLENNPDFISSFTANGYDLILPISFNTYNWLEAGGQVFIDTLTKLYAGDYPSVYLSGFSDGGTGAYRYFYKNPERYNGVIIFNGYPQLNNFNKTVDYKKTRNKKVLFVSQISDKIIPYEFLLTEYRRQKMLNNETYFILTEGKHQFVKYSGNDFKRYDSLLNLKNTVYEDSKDLEWIFPSIDGLIVNNKLIAVYDFRAKTGKSYGMNKIEYLSNSLNTKRLKKIVKDNSIEIYPLKISKADLLNDSFEFKIKSKFGEDSIIINNYLNQKAWGN